MTAPKKPRKPAFEVGEVVGCSYPGARSIDRFVVIRVEDVGVDGSDTGFVVFTRGALCEHCQRKPANKGGLDQSWFYKVPR